MFTRKKIAIAALLAIGAAALHAQQSTAGRTLVRAGHLLDVKTGKLLDAQTMVVVGQTIQSVAPRPMCRRRREMRWWTWAG